MAITATPTAPAITGLDVAGGLGANAINLAAVNETDFTDLDTVTVDGGGVADTINGSQLAGPPEGRRGNDRMIGTTTPAARATTCAARTATISSFEPGRW